MVWGEVGRYSNGYSYTVTPRLRQLSRLVTRMITRQIGWGVRGIFDMTLSLFQRSNLQLSGPPTRT